MGVPKTDISVNFMNGTARVKSPKQIEAKNFRAEYDPVSKKAIVTFDQLSSKNDADILGVVAAANAKTADAIEKTSGNLKDITETLASKMK